MTLSLIKVGKAFPEFNAKHGQPFLSQLVKCRKLLKHTLAEKSQCEMAFNISVYIYICYC